MVFKTVQSRRPQNKRHQSLVRERIIQKQTNVVLNFWLECWLIFLNPSLYVHVGTVWGFFTVLCPKLPNLSWVGLIIFHASGQESHSRYSLVMFGFPESLNYEAITSFTQIDSSVGLVPPSYHGTGHNSYPPNNWYIRKIIDSKVPAGMGYVSSLEGICWLEKSAPSAKQNHLTPTLQHNGTVVSGTTSNSLVPEGIPSQQKGGSIGGLSMDIMQKRIVRDIICWSSTIIFGSYWGIYIISS